jgi:hypothetical protein
MATARPATEPISVKPAVAPDTGLVSVNVFDGTRQRRVSIALRHSQMEFTEFYSLRVC